jgi:hypothetical protein
LIVPYLQGGLGNQLFQIANAYAYAKRYGYDFAINYNLSFCPNQGNVASNYRYTIYQNFDATDEIPKLIFSEKSFGYDEIPDLGGDVLFKGYFQSIKYFQDFSKDFKREIFFYSNDCGFVGVHIRLGDYLMKPFSDYHGLVGEDYYRNALEQFRGRSIVLFTNGERVDFLNDHDIYYSESKNEVSDLRLMSRMKNLVICNSSFSWWGAFLGVDKDVVVAPKKWFGETGPKNFNDIYVEGWVKK